MPRETQVYLKLYTVKLHHSKGTHILRNRETTVGRGLGSKWIAKEEENGRKKDRGEVGAELKGSSAWCTHNRGQGFSFK